MLVLLMSDLKTSYPSYFRWEVPRSERVGAAGIGHQQRTQVQERSLVQRLREQIGNLLLSRDPVDVDDEVKVELAGVLHPDLDGWQQGGERKAVWSG